MNTPSNMYLNRDVTSCFSLISVGCSRLECPRRIRTISYYFGASRPAARRARLPGRPETGGSTPPRKPKTPQSRNIPMYRYVFEENMYMYIYIYNIHVTWMYTFNQNRDPGVISGMFDH